MKIFCIFVLSCILAFKLSKRDNLNYHHHHHHHHTEPSPLYPCPAGREFFSDFEFYDVLGWFTVVKDFVLLYSKHLASHCCCCNYSWKFSSCCDTRIFMWFSILLISDLCCCGSIVYFVFVFWFLLCLDLFNTTFLKYITTILCSLSDIFVSYYPTSSVFPKPQTSIISFRYLKMETNYNAWHTNNKLKIVDGR